MGKLLWDLVGDRQYEAGLDRGVLYLANNSGIPWNGLVSVDEDTSGDSSESKFFDGIKYLDFQSIGDYSATLSAYTYPDEFMEYEGIATLGNGLSVDGQNTNLFGLSYRTLVGNSVLGTDLGYKIHVVYNLTAAADVNSHATLSESPTPLLFSWNISALPETIPGYRPTAHAIFDSRFLPSVVMEGLEAVLYGDDTDDARLPTLVELADLVMLWDPKLIDPNNVTGLSALVNGIGDLTQTNVDGVFAALPTTGLFETSTPGLYSLNPSIPT